MTTTTTPLACRKPHVILAEDNADLRFMLTEVLGALGTNVESVADGGRLLVCIASQYNEGRTPAQVDLIVTDIGLPVCGGLEILDAIRAAGWKTPLLVITGLPSPTVSMRVTRLGAKLLVKPLNLEMFQEEVMGLLAAGVPLAKAPQSYARPMG